MVTWRSALLCSLRLDDHKHRGLSSFPSWESFMAVLPSGPQSLFELQLDST